VIGKYIIRKIRKVNNKDIN